MHLHGNKATCRKTGDHNLQFSEFKQDRDFRNATIRNGFMNTNTL